jgi:hypothetical protein
MQAQNTQICPAFIPNIIKPTSAHIGGSAHVLLELPYRSV